MADVPMLWNYHDDEIETFSALLTLCEGNPLVTGEFPSQRPVTRNFDIFFVLRWTKGLTNNRDAGHLERHRTYYGVTVMMLLSSVGKSRNTIIA